LLAPQSLRTQDLAKGCEVFIGKSVKNIRGDNRCKMDTRVTQNVILGRSSARFESAADPARSGGVDGCGVQQHDGDIVLNGVDAAALSAFQALLIRSENYRLYANRTHQLG